MLTVCATRCNIKKLYFYFAQPLAYAPTSYVAKKKNIYIYIYIYIHTHTRVYIYIYIYIYIYTVYILNRSQWSCGLRRGSAASR